VRVSVQDEATKQISTAIVSPGDETTTMEITFDGAPIGKGSSGKVSMVFQLLRGKFAAFKLAIINQKDVAYANAAIRDVIKEAKLLKIFDGSEGLQAAPHDVVDITSEWRDPVVGHISPLYSGPINSVVPETRKQRMFCAKQLFSGLKKLHGKFGYIHCDIKPDNIFMKSPELTGDGTYKAVLADFGGARSFVDLKKIFDAEKSQKQTVKLIPGGLWGTWSPSFCSFTDIDAVTKAYNEGNFEKYKKIMKARDVYALGLGLVFTFAFEGGYGKASYDIRASLLTHISNKGTLPDEIKIALRKNGLGEKQIFALEKAISSDWSQRPTAKKSSSGFLF
jgi:serine/threonine protein kinase